MKKTMELSQREAEALTEERKFLEQVPFLSFNLYLNLKFLNIYHMTFVM